MKETLLNVQEISSFLHVHPKSIYRWVSEGRIPYHKINGLIRFKKQEIEDRQEKNNIKNIKPLELFPNIDISIKDYDKMLLKGRSALSKKSKRWNYGFGSVYIRKTKAGNFRWYIDYYDANAERIRKVVKDAQTKEDAFFALRNEVLKTFYKKNGIKCRKKIGFREFSKMYLSDYATAEKKKSWMTDEFRLRKLKEFFKDTELSEISTSMIRKFRVWRLEEGNTKSTCNRYLALLKRMFYLAIEDGYVEMNPVKNVKFFSEIDTLKERVLSAEEERRLLEASSEHLSPIILTALNTGMRRGEILNLKWSSVDLAKRVIKVEKAKSGKVRFIPINDGLHEELMRLKRENEKGEFVFPFKSVRTAFENACKRAGFKIRFHDLRHTFATRLIEEGVDIVTVQSLLGHCSVLVTQRYTHSCDERKRMAVELLNQKTKERAKKKVKLAHLGHTEKEEQLDRLPISSFSMN